jgi:hypothetical protein
VELLDYISQGLNHAPGLPARRPCEIWPSCRICDE